LKTEKKTENKWNGIPEQKVRGSFKEAKEPVTPVELRSSTSRSKSLR